MSDLLPFAAHVAEIAIVAGLIGLAIGWAHAARTGDAR